MELVVYLSDDTLSLISKKRVIKKTMNSIKQGLIVNAKSFTDDFLAILKNAKIKSKLFGDKIKIVQDAFYNVRDLIYLKNIFSEMGFLRVEFWPIKEAFNKKYTYIGIFKDYMILYLDKALVVDLEYVKDIEKVITYFREYYQDYVVLFGSNDLIPKIHLDKINGYYIDDYKDYITSCLLLRN